MGKLQKLTTPHAILEMRGYLGKSISLWLSREMDNANKIWNDQDLLTGIGDYKTARDKSVKDYYACLNANGKKDPEIHKCAKANFIL